MLPLEYQPDDKPAEWRSAVRMLAILCIIDGTTSALADSFYAWNFGPFKSALMGAGATPTIVFFLLVSFVVNACLNALLAIAGVGSLKPIPLCRQLVVVCCGLRIFAGFAESILEFFVYPGRNGYELGLESLPRSISAAVFPLAVAFIFTRKPLQEAFASR